MRICVPETAFVQNCRPNTKGSDTLVGRLRKAGMYQAFIYLFIYLFFFYLIPFFVRVSLECKYVEGHISVYQAASFGHFIFHQERVLDQTITNLQQNTIGLKFLDFNRNLF